MHSVKTSILLGYRCNNNCRFCYCGDKKETVPPLSTEEAKTKIELGRKQGSTIVDFLGGEPTIRKDLPELIEFAKKTGYRSVSITTNGRMLSDRNYAEKLACSGLTQVIFSVHGHTPKLHDFLTQTEGSFEQLEQGMKNLKEANPKIYYCTNTVILKPNIKHLPEIAAKCIELGANGMEFIFPHPMGNARKNFDCMVPRLGELIGVLQETVAVGTKNGLKHIAVRYVPFCYLRGIEFFAGEYSALSEMKEVHLAPEFEDFNVEQGRKASGRVKGIQCFGCTKNDECEGIFNYYAEKRGFSELVPIG